MYSVQLVIVYCYLAKIRGIVSPQSSVKVKVYYGTGGKDRYRKF